MLSINDTMLLLIDAQEKLFNAMSNKEDLQKNTQRLVEGLKVLDVPIVVTEQNPKGLGPTINEIVELLPAYNPLDKKCFSCCQAPNIMEATKAVGRPNILLAGIEMHVCVYQTCAELLEMGYRVEIVADAVSSRSEYNKHIGLKKCLGLGASVTCVETALFELLRTAEHEHFKAISKIIR